MSDEFKNLVTGLYDLLLPVTDSELRKRAVKSALMMLGEDPGFVEQKQQPKGSGGSGSPSGADEDSGSEYNAKAALWVRRNKVSAEQIEHVLHIDGENVDLIADKVPGANGGEKVINTYVLVGIRELFRTGEPRFTDELARTECERMGTHGKTNHATYLRTPGKAMTGSVKTGWTLTAPGLTAGAELVKALAGES